MKRFLVFGALMACGGAASEIGTGGAIRDVTGETDAHNDTDDSSAIPDAALSDVQIVDSADAGCVFNADTYCAMSGLNCGFAPICGAQVACGSCGPDSVCGDSKPNVCGSACKDRPDMRSACPGGFGAWTVAAGCSGRPWRSGPVFRSEDVTEGCVLVTYLGQQWRCCTAP